MATYNHTDTYEYRCVCGNHGQFTMTTVCSDPEILIVDWFQRGQLDSIKCHECGRWRRVKKVDDVELEIPEKPLPDYCQKCGEIYECREMVKPCRR